MVAQGRAVIFGSEQSATLQFRHNEIDEILQPPGG
jgi:hypothetical protein